MEKRAGECERVEDLLDAGLEGIDVNGAVREFCLTRVELGNDGSEMIMARAGQHVRCARACAAGREAGTSEPSPALDGFA